MSDIAKHVTDDTGPGLYVTRYSNPHDGHQYVGPQIKAASRAEADRIVAVLSYSGQPLTIDGLLVEEFPAEMADPAKRAAVKAQIDDELRGLLRGKDD